VQVGAGEWSRARALEPRFAFEPQIRTEQASGRLMLIGRRR